MWQMCRCGPDTRVAAYFWIRLPSAILRHFAGADRRDSLSRQVYNLRCGPACSIYISMLFFLI